MKASTVPAEPFLSGSLFPWIRELEANWRDIRAELDQVLERPDDIPSIQQISVRQSSLTTDDRWKTFFFYAYGVRADMNCERCPRTAALVAAIPAMRTAFFSILGPGKVLPPHRGPYRGVLRYHLGLRIPEPSDECGIRVGPEIRHWREGQSLIFDDTLEHSAWNHTSDVRVVLFVDIERPLREPFATLNRRVLDLVAASPYIRHARKRFEDWEARSSLRSEA